MELAAFTGGYCDRAAGVRHLPASGHFAAGESPAVFTPVALSAVGRWE